MAGKERLTTPKVFRTATQRIVGRYQAIGEKRAEIERLQREVDDLENKVAADKLEMERTCLDMGCPSVRLVVRSDAPRESQLVLVVSGGHPPNVHAQQSGFVVSPAEHPEEYANLRLGDKALLIVPKVAHRLGLFPDGTTHVFFEDSLVDLSL